MVCRTWRRVAERNNLWLPFLRLHFLGNAIATGEPTRESVSFEEHAKRAEFGALRLMDLVLLPPWFPFPMPTKRKYATAPFALSDFVKFPWHPRRHSRLGLLNIVRLVRAYIWHARAFLCLSGARTPFKGGRSPDVKQRCIQHRVRLGYSSADTMVRLVLRAIVYGCLLSFVLTTYVTFFSRWRALFQAWSILDTVRITVLGLPLGAGYAILRPFDMSFMPLAAVHGSVALALSWPYMTELWQLRLMLPLAGSAVMMYFRTWARPLHNFTAGFLLGTVIAMARTSVPIALTGLCYLSVSSYIAPLFEFGYTS